MSEQTAREIAREIVELKCSHESATSEHLCTCGDIIMWHLERERRENKACKEVILELEAKLKAFEFMTGGGRDDVRYSANKIACLEAEVKRLRNKFGKDENGEFIYNDQEIIDALKDERAWNQTLRNEITTLKQSLEQARELIRKAVDSECDHGLEINPVPCGLCDDEIRAFLTSPPQAVKEPEFEIQVAPGVWKTLAQLKRDIDGLVIRSAFNDDEKTSPKKAETMPCGHKPDAVAFGEEGTNFCRDCEKEGKAMRLKEGS